MFCLLKRYFQEQTLGSPNDSGERIMRNDQVFYHEQQQQPVQQV
jgi:hypothetical protein